MNERYFKKNKEGKEDFVDDAQHRSQNSTNELQMIAESERVGGILRRSDARQMSTIQKNRANMSQESQRFFSSFGNYYGELQTNLVAPSQPPVSPQAPLSIETYSNIGNPYLQTIKPLWFLRQCQETTRLQPSAAFHHPSNDLFRSGSQHHFKRFELQEQPSVRQRKCTQQNNRYLAPNPLIICPRKLEDLPPILEGVVTVALTRKDFQEITDHSKYFVENNNQRLSVEGKAHFSVKVFDTLPENSLRLAFKITYKVAGVGTCEEILYTRPFVCFTSRKNQEEKLGVIALKPSGNFGNSTEDVWIKGSWFRDAEVTFDGLPAEIIEATENLLIVKPPPRIGVTAPIASVVSVYNVSPSGRSKADTDLTYFYLPED